jgi:hypothetical protein
MILKIGDMVGYSDNKKAMIEKIRIISKAEFIEECKYDGEEDDIVLTLRDEAGTINLWIKNNPVWLLEEKKEKKKP